MKNPAEFGGVLLTEKNNMGDPLQTQICSKTLGSRLLTTASGQHN